jgi:hypothetical protein
VAGRLASSAVNTLLGKAASKPLGGFEIRTTASPSSAVQCVLSGGPNTVASHARHVQVVWPPPWPRQAWWPTRTWFGPSGWPLGASRRWVGDPLPARGLN